MDLLRQIRASRAEGRRKEPFRPTLYTRVGALVRRYGLDDAFVHGLRTPLSSLRREERGAVPPRRKEVLFNSVLE